jgi:hypothetical protein
MYSEIFLRLEPLGPEWVAGAAQEAGHEVRVVDLQVLSRADLAAELASFQPGAVGISLMEAARKLGISVAINLIVDPAWDAERFQAVREFALAVPEIANFARMLWRFNKVYNAGRQYADHQRPVRYELPLPPPRPGHRSELYIHSRAAAVAGPRRPS